MSDPAPFHILLVYPPVASPAAPPGISASVAGHLAGFGLSLNHYDANLDFFSNYILNPQTLAGLLERIEKGKRQGRCTSRGRGQESYHLGTGQGAG